MGTTHSAEKEWKGPFSDEEYECLKLKYKEIAAAGSGAQERIQSFFQLTLELEIPSEWRFGFEHLGASFYELCLHTRLPNETKSNDPVLKLIDFVRGVADCVRSSSRTVSRSMFQLFAGDKSSIYLNESELHQLLLACLVMADNTVASEEPHHVITMTKRLADAAFPCGIIPKGSRQLSLDDFTRWTNSQSPLLFSVFTSWLSQRFFGAIARPSYHSPELSHKSDILSRSHFIALSLTCTPLQQRIERLYTNTQDGLSFNRLCYHILGYGGPSLVVIRSTDGDVFGMYCDTEWRETTRFYGSNACFLFRFEPSVSIYRTSSDPTENYMYLNTKGYALPKGLGMGGTVNGFRLFLNEDLDEGCYTRSKCLSFEPGQLTTRDSFVVDGIEVWGCGGEESRRQQSQYRKDTHEMIDKMRKVDKAAFMGNAFDREMFLSKTFGHGTDQARIVEDVQ